MVRRLGVLGQVEADTDRLALGPWQALGALGEEIGADELRDLSAALSLVADEGMTKRSRARFLAFGVNGVGVALMILVFAHTGGLVGAEVGVAGGTAASRAARASRAVRARRTTTRSARATS